MTIDINTGENFIDVFPGTETIELSTFDIHLLQVRLSGGWAFGFTSYIPGDKFNTLTTFTPGSGIYIVEASSPFQIEYN